MVTAGGQLANDLLVGLRRGAHAELAVVARKLVKRRVRTRRTLINTALRHNYRSAYLI